jgi:hypothetical protein
MRFTMGDGSALVDFESFQGAIRLLQAGSVDANRLLERRGRSMEELRRRLERNAREYEKLLERQQESGGDEDE